LLGNEEWTRLALDAWKTYGAIKGPETGISLVISSEEQSLLESSTVLEGGAGAINGN